MSRGLRAGICAAGNPLIRYQARCVQHATYIELDLGLGETVTIEGINQEDNAVNGGEVVSPELAGCAEAKWKV
jgi:hypothetical protein